MQTQVQAKGFEIHDAQKFLVNKATSRVERYLYKLSKAEPQINVVISCHHTPHPVFSVHTYLELSDSKISATSTSRRFPEAVNDSIDHLLRQIRKRKTVLLNRRDPSVSVLETA